MNRYLLHLMAAVILGIALLSMSLRSEKPLALLYYSNESCPVGPEHEAFTTAAKWLNSTKEPKLVKFAKRIEEDGNLFGKMVDKEVEAFRGAQVNGTLPFPLMLVTNRLAKSGKALLFLPDAREPKEFMLNFQPGTVPPLAQNPTSNPDYFEAFLKLARQQLPADQFDYLLITKSHGNTELAMMPFLRLWPGEVDEADFLGLARESLLTKKNVNQNLPLDAHLRGISKDSYRSILEQSTMAFRLVVMESCFGGPSAEASTTAVTLPRNVQKLYGASDHGIPYDNFDYTQLLQSSPTAKLFVENYERELHEKFSVERRRFSVEQIVWVTLFLALMATFVSLVKTIRARPMRVSSITSSANLES